MNYKVLYRKYRPIDFSEIVGQTHITEILKKAIISNKIAHAYLFAGPRGTGKTSTAKAFARAINCDDPKNGMPCGNCFVCKNVNDNPDIIEIDAASNNGVDEIRELRNNVKILPSNLKYKIYIIDEVHMLTISAFNALLKTLEEPPAHVIFILATTDPQKIPLTVISRCQRYDFKKIAIDTIIERLNYICKKEKIKIENDALKEIAYISDGAMRDSLGMLEQLSTLSDNEITLELITNIYKSITQTSLEHIYTNLENNDIAKTIECLQEIKVNGVDYIIFVNKMIEFLRKKAENVKLFPKSCKLSFTKIKHLIFALNNLLIEAKSSLDPYILVELTILDILDSEIEKENIETSGNVVTENKDKVDEEENNLKLEKPLTEENKSVVVNKNINREVRINNCLAEANKKEKDSMSKKWMEFVENEMEKDIAIYNVLVDSNVEAASKTILLISVKEESQNVLFQKKILEISKDLNQFLEKEVKIVSISLEEWKKIKQKYIEDLKNKIKYIVKPEIEEKEKKKRVSKVEKIANEIFENSNIEIR